MTDPVLSGTVSRRQVLAAALALASNAISAPRKYAPRIVCNETLWTQMLPNPPLYISSTPDPLKVPRPRPDRPTGAAHHLGDNR